ncbi:unnamed protein product [Kuraishia capsulata CBS 1993]|uniref:Pal1 cell morphology protein n=1 Tax=Kuraishia capsulata CBS 1993 TaxID=1382522 RepID=W6MKT7_9ASCO|nr:uncharacterized protein KUCA_T00002636001 [Kuraishia capsulata CBS 1993]CDK26663.1 unnamed protein product [Kuraishia capsulata CBS 1993]
MSVPEGRYSNNPFADALTPTSTGSRASGSNPSHQRPRVAPPSQQAPVQQQRPRRSKDESAMPPPSYEEAAGRRAARSEYPREKQPQQSSEARRHEHSSSRTREHRSRSEGEVNGEHRHRSHRHRERGERSESSRHHKDSSPKRSSRHRSSRSKKQTEIEKPENLDTIDKLDVTGFFGGGAFHHDGPFDACTPHRNKNTKAAPVMAFPVDGPNSTIRGMGPLHTKEQQIDILFGNADKADEMYASTAPIARTRSVPQQATSAPTQQYTTLQASQSQKRTIPPSSQALDPNSYSHGALVDDSRAPPVTNSVEVLKHDPSVVAFDANAKATPVHGTTTLGLGSSTFLDGAPATKAAIHEASTKSELSRNRSLVNRMRKKSSDLPGNEAHYEESAPSGNSLLRRVKSLKVSRK